MDADPVLLDIKEVCQGVDQEALQETAETPTQSASLLALDDSSASPTEGPALKDVFSPQLDSSSGQSNQASSTSDLMEVFSIKLEDSLTPTQSSPVPPPTCPPEPTLSTSQILSMFPTQPAGGSPYCSPPYSPNNMPWGQPGILGNQWAAPWPTMPGNMSAWAQPGVTAHLPGSQTQAHSVVSPQLGVTMGGNTAGFLAPPSALNGYPPPANYLSHPTGSTGGLQSASPTTDNPSLL
ncbi:uncharacterized protein [Brachyistius frenatus]|uniref:uncharacterized protein n=1 Tax=Brachyistius frenatus TaxID=100188 RepID=UPI0037E98A65